jgi:hypothetical protein
MRDREPLATTMETFWDFWFELGLGNDADMRTVFASERLDFFPDPYEPNDLIEQAVAAVFGVPYGITFYRAGPTAGGDQDWFRFDAEAGEDYHILIEGVPDLIFGRPDPEMFVIDAVNGLVIAHSDEQCDSSTNTQGSSSAQDMSETTPSIRFRAPATQTYHILLRHDSDAINLTHRYGSCRLYVNHAAPPAPDIVRSSAQLMRPGQSYRVALCAEEAFVDATFTASDAGITISDVHPRGAGMFDMLATVAPEVPDGIYSVTLTNPDGTSDTRVGVIRVNAANAEPELVISEIQITEPNQIEITNIGTADADLTGWQIQARSIFFAGVQLFTFPEFSLAPGATVVVSDADGVNTATELFDTGNTFDWLLESGGGGDVRLIDDLFGLADQVRWVRRVVDFQWSLAGVWMQPEILTTSAGTFSRHLPSGRKWSTDALSVAMASMPAGASGRENLVDAFEPNENPRDVPILIPDVLLEDLAIHPKPEELEEGADEDWFGVLLQTGDSLRATIAFTHADGNLDMEIYAPGEESTPLAVSSTTTDGEFITLPAADITTNGGGIYRIRIFGPDFSTNAYSLHLSDGTKTAQDVIDYLVRRTTDPTGLEFNGQPGIDAADLVTAIVQEN